MEWTQLITQAAAITLSFLFGRYTAYKTDRQTALKEINNNFLTPVLSLIKDTCHSAAYHVSDIPSEKLQQILKLLNDNSSYLSPQIVKLIEPIDMILSNRFGISGTSDSELSETDIQSLDILFGNLYRKLVEYQKRITRKIYCTAWERFIFWWVEIWR